MPKIPDPKWDFPNGQAMRAHAFQPGQSGNPAGRRRGVT